MTTRRPAVTIQDVARRAGVSVATVSRTLNGHPTVDPDLAVRVRRAVVETGYVPNPAGRALRRQETADRTAPAPAPGPAADAAGPAARPRPTGMWAVLVPNLGRFFTGVVSAFEAAALERGRSVILCNTYGDPGREARHMGAVIAHRVSGVALAAADERDSDLSLLQEAGVPLVLVDRVTAGHRGDAVVLDNEAAGRLAAEHLLARGRRRLACIGGPPGRTSVDGRLRGFSAAASDAGAEANRVVRGSRATPGGGAQAVRSLLAGPQAPDAIYAATGPLTRGAYQALRQVPVPRRPVLVGHDEETWTHLVDPPVSAVTQPVVQIGRTAAALLARRAADPACAPRRVVLHPRLVDGPPPADGW